MAQSVVLDFTDEYNNLIGQLEILPIVKAHDNAKDSNAIRLIPEQEAIEHGESTIQLLEGYSYEYELRNIRPGYRLRENEVITRLRLSNSGGDRGLLKTGLNTGLLVLEIEDEHGNVICTKDVEVISTKINYRDDYRHMLNYIADKCMELLFDIANPTQIRLSVGTVNNESTIQQKLFFLKDLLRSDLFKESIQRIVTYPYTAQSDVLCSRPIQKGFTTNRRNIRELVKGQPREPIPHEHPLSLVLRDIPKRIDSYEKVESYDTPENRFIKFVIEDFVFFLDDMMKSISSISSRNRWAKNLTTDILNLSNELSSILNCEVFRKSGSMQKIPFASPVLQRKGGYKEIFQIWLKFYVAANIVWEGSEGVFGAGKKDMAILYEYWVFFKLIEVYCSVFNTNEPLTSTLFERSRDGFRLKIKSGKSINIYGTCKIGNVSFSSRLSYNRTFSGNQKAPNGGSWTRPMRPDYTLSIWPQHLTENVAELSDKISHIHFDAKYRVDHLRDSFGDDSEGDIELEKYSDKIGKTAKRADLLKMHAYRDAIRRSDGAYVIYPGDISIEWHYFHEIIPGLGAFVLRPGYEEESKKILKDFIIDVINCISKQSSDHD